MGEKKTDSKRIQDALVEDTMSKEHRAVSRYLSTVKFQPSVLGVDPVDVWRKTEKLCELYEDALDAERARADDMEKRFKAVCAKLKEVTVLLEKQNARVSAAKAELKAGSPEEQPNGEA